MGLEQTNEQHYREVVDKYHDPLVDYQMTTRDYVVRPTVVAAAIVITLPPVAEAKGRFYTIKPRGNIDITWTVTIQDRDDSEGPGADIVLSSIGQSVVLYSDGLTWHSNSATDLVGLLVAPATAIAAGLHIAGPWDEGFNSAGILIAADTAGTALALGTAATSWTFERVNVTAAATAGYIMGKYVTIATSAAIGDDGTGNVGSMIMGHYVKVTIAHQAWENYAIRGRMIVSVDQDDGFGNQYMGLFGGVEFAAGTYDLAASGGGYGVLGTANIAAGSTFDQPLLAGYFDCNPLSDIAGETAAVKARMQGYTDWGLSVLCQTSLGFAGVYIRTQDAAILPAGIKFEANAGGGVSYINHAFWFFAADMTDGAYVAATAIDTPETAQGVIKINCNDTNYYIPFYDDGDIDTEWADH